MAPQFWLGLFYGVCLGAGVMCCVSLYLINRRVQRWLKRESEATHG